jgi:hypothetical protein
VLAEPDKPQNFGDAAIDLFDRQVGFLVQAIPDVLGDGQ